MLPLQQVTAVPQLHPSFPLQQLQHLQQQQADWHHSWLHPHHLAHSSLPPQSRRLKFLIELAELLERRFLVDLQPRQLVLFVPRLGWQQHYPRQITLQRFVPAEPLMQQLPQVIPQPAQWPPKQQLQHLQQFPKPQAQPKLHLPELNCPQQGPLDRLP